MKMNLRVQLFDFDNFAKSSLAKRRKDFICKMTNHILNFVFKLYLFLIKNFKKS